jgi:hypothetical protein
MFEDKEAVALLSEADTLSCNPAQDVPQMDAPEARAKAGQTVKAPSAGF